MNRRAVLKSGPAVALAACVPLPAAAGETGVEKAYRAFIAHREWAEATDLSDDEIDASNVKAEEMLRDLVAIPPERPADTAIKFLVVTMDYEALYGNPYRERLEAEVRALIRGAA
ncbi:hypothetical protein SAMN04487972_101333 [Paracoccus halophilus]|uniref:Uncharacterized protein n=1 Tax=Paracoccus halophilus TaxID=376733 RepID=A0A099F2V5_9RHOB|nr:hypothetical protein [Paracoccus halophilus]KGJ05000.1 hypothetical protein IT41_08250 [Paracoccus halophilus]SFA39668.1 hypothetical protein SAMN04487972_101333 [Paracoccus halophilus]